VFRELHEKSNQSLAFSQETSHCAEGSLSAVSVRCGTSLKRHHKQARVINGMVLKLHCTVTAKGDFKVSDMGRCHLS